MNDLFKTDDLKETNHSKETDYSKEVDEFIAKLEHSLKLHELSPDTDINDYDLDMKYLEDGLSENDPLRHYLAEIGNIPLLTAEQERMLLTKKEGETEQEKANKKQQLVASNLRLVVAIAKKNNFYEQNLLDLVSEGNLALLHAIEHYNHDENPEFRPYAVKYIAESLKKEEEERNRSKRLPVHLIPLIEEISRARRKYMAEHNDEQPSSAELANILSMEESEIDNLLPYVYRYFLTCSDCWSSTCRYSRSYEGPDEDEDMDDNVDENANDNDKPVQEFQLTF